MLLVAAMISRPVILLRDGLCHHLHLPHLHVRDANMLSSCAGKVDDAALVIGEAVIDRHVYRAAIHDVLDRYHGAKGQ